MGLRESYIIAKLNATHELNMRLIEGWYDKLKRLWTIRIAVFWVGLSALAGVWGALVGTIPNWVYVTGGILMNVSLGIARLLKQPGVDE